MYDCKHCQKEYKEISSRIRHLENASYDYERLKGKGSFKKNNKEAQDILESLVKKKVDLAVAHTKHQFSDDPSSSLSGAPIGTNTY